MNPLLVSKAEAFLAETFAASPYLQAHPEELEYRMQHSYRVANIAKAIAAAEGFSVTAAVIAGLLHDIAYCEEMPDREARLCHGRRSAAIARPFLETLELDPGTVQEICYGIAIHVDGKADFPGNTTPFAETVSDADNIDRFDAYRIYETLEYQKYSSLPFGQKQTLVEKTLARLNELRELAFGTQTAKTLWLQRLDDYEAFYERLQSQLHTSTKIL